MLKQLVEAYGKLYQERNIFKTMVLGINQSLNADDFSDNQRICIQSLQIQYSRLDAAIQEVSVLIAAVSEVNK